MILHVNYLGTGVAAPAGAAVASILAAVDQSGLDAQVLARLRVHLDWIQYRANFRDPVTVRHAADAGGQPLSLAELAIDLRQTSGDELREVLARALTSIGPDPPRDERVYLGDFTPLRDSVAWRFNRLFWQRLADWEAATGHGFEQALPSGRSDALHAEAVADSVAEFWTLLRELDKRGQLPAEVFALEIGVGTGGRAAAWLDRFQALDEARGTDYYPRLRFLLGDYAMPTLERARQTVEGHREIVLTRSLWTICERSSRPLTTAGCRLRHPATAVGPVWNARGRSPSPPVARPGSCQGHGRGASHVEPSAPGAYQDRAGAASRFLHPIADNTAEWRPGSTTGAWSVVQGLHKLKVTSLDPAAFVFGRGGTRPFDTTELRRRWRRALAAAKVRYRPPEQLRHGMASTLLSRNAPLLYVQHQGGWRTANVLLKVYARWLPQEPVGSHLQAPSGTLLSPASMASQLK